MASLQKKVSQKQFLRLKQIITKSFRSKNESTRRKELYQPKERQVDSESSSEKEPSRLKPNTDSFDGFDTS